MKFTVLSPISHNGKTHGVDAVVELSEEAAAPLLASGDIAPKKVSKADADAEAKAKAEAEAKAKAEAEAKPKAEADVKKAAEKK